MRGKLMLGVVALAVLTACTRKQDGVIMLESKNDETVNVTASCGGTNQIDVAVDKWEIYMKKQGEVTFNVVASNGASVELTQKTADSWPFTDGPPYKGSKKGKIKNRDGTYNYNVRVACALASGDSARVVIDPDIFVN